VRAGGGSGDFVHAAVVLDGLEAGGRKLEDLTLDTADNVLVGKLDTRERAGFQLELYLAIGMRPPLERTAFVALLAAALAAAA